MNSKNVFIDKKEFFKSKNSIYRFKNDLKKEKENMNSEDYLNNGYDFKINKISNNIHVNIISKEESLKLQKREELRKKLKVAQYNRSNKPTQKLNSLKRSVPDDIFKSYYDIIKKYHFDIPAPDDVINDLDKYKTQVSLLMNTNQKISNDPIANNKVKKYFKLLGDFLGVKPFEIPTHLPEQKNNSELNNDSDTEDEEPTLVKV